MTQLLAALPMYDFPEIRDATDKFWSLIADELWKRGFTNAPSHLDRPDDLPAFWSSRDLLFGQTCGYPLYLGLCGEAQLVATPIYGAPGCEGHRYGSLLIVPAQSDHQVLRDTQGRICAINSADSNTGMNVLRASIAAIGGKASFYSQIIETTSHRNSLAMVARGEAQIAAIDQVSFAHFARLEPQSVEAVRVIGETPKTPGLPFITSASTSTEQLALLREALVAVLHHSPRHACLDTLLLKDITVLSRQAYREISDLADLAVQSGYPVLA